ncbi:CPBP family intramembrane glutamic endopeptidase [Nocardioides pantholopis]|uniref:CPBP family intramembrane glutamic endopeptidase n=1 Tax=Nocardioides pantholopis TaxID=2483798 RepID=UPI000FDA64A3|nr:CPBP family intramembrane glutamic endopeptidase [Nocardioides pantholopis]
MTALIRRHPLTAFFVLAYLGSWTVWSPWWLSRSGVGVLPFEPSFAAVAGINQLGLFAGPFAAALVVARIAEGPGAPRRLLDRVLQWRVRQRWYVLALVAIPLATAAGYLLSPGTALSPEDGAAATSVLVTTTFLVYLLGGPIQEEPGWRGFALPRLQRRLHPMTAALVLGVIHCCWHAPLFLTEEWDTARQDPGQLLAYLVLVVSMSFVLSWLANGADGSVLLVVLGHNAVNWALFSAGHLTGEPVADNWPAAIGLAVLASIAVVTTRGRLGHPSTRGGGGALIEPAPDVLAGRARSGR